MDVTQIDTSSAFNADELALLKILQTKMKNQKKVAAGLKDTLFNALFEAVPIAEWEPLLMVSDSATVSGTIDGIRYSVQVRNLGEVKEPTKVEGAEGDSAVEPAADGAI